jgi:hypothetical protein
MQWRSLARRSGGLSATKLHGFWTVGDTPDPSIPNLALEDPAPSAGTTHSVTAAAMAFTGQAVAVIRATNSLASAASMAMAGQSVSSSNTIIHTVAAASMAYAGQAVASIAARVHSVTAALKAMAGQLVGSVAATSHQTGTASKIYTGQEVLGSGSSGPGDAPLSGYYGRHYGYRRY